MEKDFGQGLFCVDESRNLSLRGVKNFMSTQYEQFQKDLLQSPKTWLITGVAGFIGSNLLEALIKLNQRVVGPDDFSTRWPSKTYHRFGRF